jgi:hypothetical protein
MQCQRAARDTWLGPGLVTSTRKVHAVCSEHGWGFGAGLFRHLGLAPLLVDEGPALLLCRRCQSRAFTPREFTNVALYAAAGL